jgi:phosphoribosylamine--glycine ligase
MAAGGYPISYDKGDVISGLESEDAEGCKVFHAGTALDGEQVVTNGGRVLCVTALGKSVSEAQKRAYGRVGTIHWNHVFYRTDIGYRAVERERAGS